MEKKKANIGIREKEADLGLLMGLGWSRLGGDEGGWRCLKQGRVRRAEHERR